MENQTVWMALMPINGKALKIDEKVIKNILIHKKFLLNNNNEKTFTCSFKDLQTAENEVNKLKGSLHKQYKCYFYNDSENNSAKYNNIGFVVNEEGKKVPYENSIKSFLIN